MGLEKEMDMARDLKKGSRRRNGLSKKVTAYHLTFVGKSAWRVSANEEALLRSLSRLESHRNISVVGILSIANTISGDAVFTIEIIGCAKNVAKEVANFKRTIKNLGLAIRSCVIV